MGMGDFNLDPTLGREIYVIKPKKYFNILYWFCCSLRKRSDSPPSYLSKGLFGI